MAKQGVSDFFTEVFGVLEGLSLILDINVELKVALENSLVKAKKEAEKHFEENKNKQLYHAINYTYRSGPNTSECYNGWPVTIEAYLVYLRQHLFLVPNELPPSKDYPDVWKSTGDHNGYSQKVYDLLCHFYWLINQKDGEGKTVQSNELFANWLIDYNTAKGKFLDDECSFNDITKYSFKVNKMYNTSLFSDDEKNWKSFNTFFCRQFNDANKETGITPLRPIAEPENNLAIVAPADCTYTQDYRIGISGHVRDISDLYNIRLTMKGFTSFGTIEELLGDAAEDHAKDFYGGTFVHYFLSPFDYHRFHTPVKGKVLEVKVIEGLMYLDVNMVNGQFDVPGGAENGYEFKQARGLIIMDAGEQVGKVAILPVGMAQICGVMMYEKLKGKFVPKGQEFGKFRFGGSDIIMLFQKPPKDLYFFKRDPAHNPIHFQYGKTAIYYPSN